MSDSHEGTNAPTGALVPSGPTRGLAGQFSNPGQDTFASWPVTSENDRVDLLRAFGRSDLRIEDILNTRFGCRKFVCHEAKVKSIATSESIIAYRSVLFLADNRTVSTVSVGVFNGLKRVVAALGCGVWEPPLVLEVRQVAVQGGGRFYELLYHGREQREPTKKEGGKK